MNKAIYFEKTNKESHINIFRSLEIENYLAHSLKKQGFNLHEHSLRFSDTKITIFLSLYEKINNKKCEINLHHRINTKQKLELYRKNAQEQIQNNFWKTSLKGLNKLTKNQYKISLKIRWVTKKFLEKNKKKTTLQLPNRFKMSEMKKLCLALATQKNTANLLSLFISESISTTKRHNFFINELKQTLKTLVEQKHSTIKGLKIILKGRLNNAPRSKNRIIQIGKIPLITQNINLDYSKAVSFTKNGTIGIKVWINQKKNRYKNVFTTKKH